MTGKQPRYIINKGVFYTSEVCEINVVDHCNLSCRSCRHLSPICEPWCVDPIRVFEDFSNLAHVYKARTLKILGGEPFLHPNLDDVLSALRESHISECLMVSTNGTHFEKMTPRFWELVDGIVLSTYPGCPFSGKFLERFLDKCQSNNVAVIIFHYDMFREAYTTQVCKDHSLVLRVYNTCKTAHVYRGHTIHKGYFYKCPHSVYLHEEIQDLPGVPERDALKITDRPDFAQDLLNFLSASDPLDACKYCLGSVGLLREHCQIKPDQWRGYQDQVFKDIVDFEYLRLLEKEPSSEDTCQTYVLDHGWQQLEERATQLFQQWIQS